MHGSMNVKFVTHTIGCFKGTAVKFIERIHSSRRNFLSTQYCLNYSTQLSVSSSCCGRHLGRVWDVST